MNYIQNLNEQLAAKELLKHPYYEAWNRGALTLEALQRYARQYYAHVDAFPRYVSAAHALCPDSADRRVLLDNLIDEDRGPDHHPELWLRFAEGLGQQRSVVEGAKAEPATQNLLNTFEELSRASWPESLGALYAYERQVPAVAASKIDGLRKFYGVNDERTLSFFEVHKTADVYHSQACAAMLEKLSPVDRAIAETAALRAAGALWGFLDGMMDDKTGAYACACGPEARA